MTNSIVKNVKKSRVAPNAGAATTFTLSAGTTDVESTPVDGLGFSGVAYTILLGALTASATLGLKIQGSADGSTGWTDITGAAYTSTVDTDDDKLVVLEVVNPKYRYTRVAFDRGGANAVIDGLICELFAGKDNPVTQPATVEAAVSVST